jgi:hypothetical protein
MENQTQTEANKELKLMNNSFELYESGGNYINQLRLYNAYFGKTPNIKAIRPIEITEMRKWIVTEWQNEIQLQHYAQAY